MTVQELYNHLDNISPFALQEQWDNSGLIVGEMGREVSEVAVSLDIDAAMIDAAKEGTVFVVHHPLIFTGLTALDFARYPANLIEKMIRKRQSCIAMHTHFDTTHLNRYVFEKVLGFTIDAEQDFVCIARGAWQQQALLAMIKERLGLSVLRVVGHAEPIRSVALTTGSGASLMDAVQADCFLTGDIKYHDAMKAHAEGRMLVDIGHYESERYFGPLMQGLLENLGILAIIMPSENPFRVA